MRSTPLLRRRDPWIAFGGLAAILLAALAVFAIVIVHSETDAKRVVEQRIHQRAVLAAAFIDGLFQTSAAQAPLYAQLYGGRTVDAQTLARHNTNAFAAVYTNDGTLLAATSGLRELGVAGTAAVTRSGALAITAAGQPYGIGNLERYGRVQAATFAVSFTTPYGRRTLVEGLSLRTLAPFLIGDLREIPGTAGSRASIVDQNDVVVASSDVKLRPPGYVFQGSQRAALASGAGTRLGRYFVVVRQHNATWRMVLSSPSGPFFASVSGTHEWAPWVVFAAFALAAFGVLVLLRRVFATTTKLRAANDRAEHLNERLAATNDELAQRAAELSRSNADLEQFASIASHDLQEPLRKVRTYTEQLGRMEAGVLSEKGTEYLRRTNNAAERMQQLIEDLLRFSRVTSQAREFAPVDLDRLVEETLDDLSAQVQRTGARLDIGPLPTVIGDEPQLRQLMQNLLSNAMKFHRDEMPPSVVVRGGTDGDLATISVKDDGIGFEPEYGQRIFRIFERLNGRSEYPGTGIGLALCRKIAERHGGTIVAASQLGEGATFTVTLPAAAQADPDPATTPDTHTDDTHARDEEILHAA